MKTKPRDSEAVKALRRVGRQIRRQADYFAQMEDATGKFYFIEAAQFIDHEIRRLTRRKEGKR